MPIFSFAFDGLLRHLKYFIVNKLAQKNLYFMLDVASG